jgi:hypothetical protein
MLKRKAFPTPATWRRQVLGTADGGEVALDWYGGAGTGYGGGLGVTDGEYELEGSDGHGPDVSGTVLHSLPFLLKLTVCS